jgi:hypothetical protein
MKVAANIQSTNTKAAAKVKNIAMKVVTKHTTLNRVADTATVAAAVVASASSVTENYAW